MLSKGTEAQNSQICDNEGLALNESFYFVLW